MLGTGKDDGLIYGLCLEQSHQGLGLIPLVSEQEGLLNLGNRLRGGGHRDFHWVGEKFLAQSPNLGRHGGRKERGLTGARQLTQNLLNSRKKAKIHHLIGFIEHHTAGMVESNMTCLHVVHESPRCCHQNIESQAQGANLGAGLRPAYHETNPHLQGTTETLEGLGNLGGQLAGGGQDEMRRRLGQRLTALFQALKQRKREGGSLAGARLRDAEKVFARHEHRNRLFLDRGGDRKALCGKGTKNRLGEPEFCKCFQGKLSLKLP